MKDVYWILLGFSACSGLVAPAHIAPEPVCTVPPAIVVLQDAPGHLAGCAKGTEAICCAYGFLPTHQQLCFHVLCQPIADCTAEWDYIKTVCPPPETEVTWPESVNPEYLLNNQY